jgi:predicted Zn finger-like uncharacterized protein
MQIICPSCAAVYSVPDEKLAGRAVKCARCSTTWTPDPPPIQAMAAPVVEPLPQRRAPAMLPAPEPKPEPKPEPPPPPPVTAGPAGRAEPEWPFITSIQQPTRPDPRPKGLMVAWVASIALLGAVVVGAYARRDAVMEAWPPSQRVYAAFGLR